MFDNNTIYWNGGDALLAIAKQSTWNHWRCLGQGPTYLKIGSRVGYRGSDINRWLEPRAGERPGGGALKPVDERSTVSPLQRWKRAAHVPVDRAVDRALSLGSARARNRRAPGRNRATLYTLNVDMAAVASPVDVDPGLYQEGRWPESLDVNGENALRESDGWAVGPFRFPK